MVLRNYILHNPTKFQVSISYSLVRRSSDGRTDGCTDGRTEGIPISPFGLYEPVGDNEHHQSY